MHRKLSLAPVLFLLSTAASVADERAATETLLLDQLRDRIEVRVARLDGIAGLYLEDLGSGQIIALGADRVMPQASVIKLPILWQLYARRDEGTLDLETRLQLPQLRVGGGGILEHLSPTAELSLRDLALFMMVESDNDATNALIDHLGSAPITARMAALGLPHTQVQRRMMDSEAARVGRENVSTPREMTLLLKRFHLSEGLSTASAAEALAMMAHTPIGPMGAREPFLERLPAGAPVFQKPGVLPGVRTVVALVRLPKRPFVVAISTAALARDGDGDDLIAELAALCYSTFDRLARMNEVGRLVD